MNKLLFILLFFSYSIFSYSQNKDFSGRWTNGFVFFWTSNYNDTIILFEGGDLHEGGSTFSVVKTETEMRILGRHPEYLEHPSIGKIGNEVVLSSADNRKYILIKDSQGKIVDFLIPMNDRNFEEVKISNKINHELAGVYIDKQTGNEITFLPNEKVVKGLVDKQNHYKFGYEYDAPRNIVVIGESSFYYDIVENGLDIFKAERDEYDDWSKKEKLMELEKIEWFNLSDNENLKGKYQFASTELLIDDILSNYTLKQLKIMRNEIFARHGYVFKTASMSEYFENQDWYHPDNGNISEKMNEIEKLNVQLIMRYEEKKRKL